MGSKPVTSGFESCTMKSAWYFAKIAQVEEQYI